MIFTQEFCFHIFCWLLIKYCYYFIVRFIDYLIKIALFSFILFQLDFESALGPLSKRYCYLGWIWRTICILCGWCYSYPDKLAANPCNTMCMLHSRRWHHLMKGYAQFNWKDSCNSKQFRRLLNIGWFILFWFWSYSVW